MSIRVMLSSLCVGWLGLLLLLIVFQGCNPVTPPVVTTSTGTPPTGTPAGKAVTAERPVKPLLDGWKKPAVVLVLSGEQHGYLEPCGCSETQSGGFSRRADLFRQLNEKGWPVVALDLGGTISSEHTRRQDKLKFETILMGLKQMHYAGLALGREELRLGADTLLAQNSDELPFLAANVTFFETPDLGRVAAKIIEANGVKIGVAAIFGLSYKPEVSLQGTDTSIADPAEVLPQVLAELEAQQPQLLVLLSHAKLPETKELAEKFPKFDVILSAGGFEDPEDKPVLIGKTRLLTVGAKGKHIGVLGFYPDDPAQRLRFELVDLDKGRFKHTPAMEELMRFYQERLQAEQLVEKEKPIPHPSGSSYTGAAKCGECHTKAYAKWKESKHARAFKSLETGRVAKEGTAAEPAEPALAWISRIHDAECLACHVTGWNPKEVYPYTSGYISESKSPLLLGQQCENCHGPGSKHVEAEEIWKKKRGAPSDEVIELRKAQHLDEKLAKDRVCYECHDLDNSPKFQFDEYWKQVKHPWRD